MLAGRHHSFDLTGNTIKTQETVLLNIGDVSETPEESLMLTYELENLADAPGAVRKAAGFFNRERGSDRGN